MKKIKITILAAFMLIGMSGFSQLSYGVSAGVAFPTLSFSEGDVDTKALTSFTLGGFGMYNLSDQFDLRVGLNYIGKGTGFDVPEEADISDMSLKINYLNIPIHGVFKLPVGGGFSSENYLHLFAGPYLGYAMSAKASNSEMDFAIKRLDLGVDIGAGFQYDKFLANITYSLGVADINAYEGDVSIKNQVFSITFGYLFSSSGYGF